MYDFYYGTKEEILQNPERYLLFIKRMMPRWLNGIPDSEFLAIWDVLNKIEQRNPVLIETGSGASSLAMFLYVVLHDGTLYSWDLNNARGAELKSIANEIICRDFNVNLDSKWKFIAYSSIDPYLGISILGELNKKVDFAFFDSLHTLDHLSAEVIMACQFLSDRSFVAVDDGNYKCKEFNYSYINMLRKKLGLTMVKEPASNITESFYLEVESLLKNKFNNVTKIDDEYKKNYLKDIFFNYYGIDKEVMNEVGMEKMDDLTHRFDAWKITK